MNDNIRAAIIEGSKSLTPGMSDDIEQALQAQRLAIKEANAKEEVNRKNKLQTEVEVQNQIAGISVPEESAYGEVDIANQMKGLVSTYTADRLAIKQGTATDEQVKRSVALDTYFTNMGDTFGTMSYVVDEFIKTKNAKGTDGMEEGSIDLSSLDPRFNELINILDPNSTAKGNVSLDVNYEDGKVKTYQVVKSEAIREENRRLYESEQDPELKKQYLDENGEISDTYKLSYDDIKNFVNNKNNNTYLVGNQFGTVPGVSPVVAYAKENGVLEKDGSPKNDYMSQVPFQKTITQNGRRVVVDVTRPEVNKIAGALKTEANSLTRLMLGGGENSAYASFIKANFNKFKGSTIDKDGNVMVYLPKRNEAGEYELDENGNFVPEDSPTEMGSSSLSGGRFNMRTGVDNQYLGMTKEDFDKANRFTQDVAMMNLNLNGASKEKINTTATNAINKPPETTKERKLNKYERTALNTEEVINNAIGAMPSSLVIKDLTSTPEVEVQKALEAQPEDVIESLSGMYPDFEFSNPETAAFNNLYSDYITVKSKRTGKRKKIEVNDGTDENVGHYETMIEWMKENGQPSGELELMQKLNAVLPNTSTVRIEDGKFKIKTPKIKSTTTTVDGEKVIEYDYQVVGDEANFDLGDKDAIIKYLEDKLIGFNTDYLKGNKSAGGSEKTMADKMRESSN